jgi:hypothetical protein
MIDVISVALADMDDGGSIQWIVTLTNGELRAGHVNSLGNGYYAIETPRPWYFHVSQVVAVAPRTFYAEAADDSSLEVAASPILDQ